MDAGYKKMQKSRKKSKASESWIDFQFSFKPIEAHKIKKKLLRSTSNPFLFTDNKYISVNCYNMCIWSAYTDALAQVQGIKSSSSCASINRKNLPMHNKRGRSGEQEGDSSTCQRACECVPIRNGSMSVSFVLYFACAAAALIVCCCFHFYCPAAIVEVKLNRWSWVGRCVFALSATNWIDVGHSRTNGVLIFAHSRIYIYVYIYICHD